MTAERWRKIESIYNSAMGLPAAERAAWLVKACGDDSALRGEIEAMLAEDDTPEALVDRPAWEYDQPVPREVTAGTRFGPYEVVALIGEGGMGQVFRASDTRLRRDVAIKIAKTRFSGRFEREARAIAALNHPNVCTLHDVGPDYLVMEHVEGKPLAGPMPLAKAIELACQILDALDAAHKRGIVHRDLKPGNILVTRAGIKVLDFGLARMTKHQLEEANQAGSFETQPGLIAGTLCYMAPEQLQARESDARADIFAFGCVLFEMLTGRRAFDGKDAASVISAVMEKPAPSLGGVAPGAVERVVRKCLEKDPEQRWESARDLKTELLWASQSEAAGLSSGTVPVRRAWIAATAALAVAGAVLAFVHFRETPAPPAGLLRFEVFPPEDAKIQPTATPVLSPDGSHIVFGAVTNEGGRLVLEDLNTGSARVYAKAVVSTNVPPPFWSPDGRYIAYSDITKLERLDRESGEVTAICDKPGPVIGGDWNASGVIIFGSTSRALWRVNAAGGKAIPLTKLDASRNEIAHEIPKFLPDGRHFIYFGYSAQPDKSGLFLSSLDQPENTRLIVQTTKTGMFVPGAPGGPGRLVWFRDDAVLAQTFDPASFELTGSPTQIVNSVGAAYQTAQFAAARDVLVYRSSGIRGGYQFARLYPKSGRTTPLGEPGFIVNAAPSPDETRIAYTLQTASGTDVRILDIAKGTSVSLTLGSNADDAQWPAWSADGKNVAYSARERGHYNIYRRPADGSGSEQLLYSGDTSARPVDWSTDGRYLLVDYVSAQDGAGEAILPLAPQSAPVRIFRASVPGMACGQFSPNQKYLAFCSGEEGHTEVYVKPFIPNEGIQAAPRWRISSHGGRRPFWSPDSRKLYYWAEGDHEVLVADINDENGFHASSPVKLYDTPARTVGVNQPMTSRGDAILKIETEVTTTEPLKVIVNWESLLTGHK